MSIAVPHPSQEGCVALFTRRYFVRVYGGTSSGYTAVLRPSIRWYFVRVYGGTSSGYTAVLRPGPWWINAAMQILNHCFTFGREASRLH
ncbi:hypothetical protein O1432_19815 [Bacteroides fragilis]|uniref:hypothetical protein n=1 Tax=Bacteroides fragilis TaxID=817 RepID=UPI0022AB4AD4|nr:hypothetical protein [Bacteroides fragilis]MCZ2617892.1 hypothetical protein [Bacteroides fragilis]MCZ2626347.1 hypothetical protein [Bacteroides fragilis]